MSRRVSLLLCHRPERQVWEPDRAEAGPRHPHPGRAQHHAAQQPHGIPLRMLQLSWGQHLATVWRCLGCVRQQVLGHIQVWRCFGCVQQQVLGHIHLLAVFRNAVCGAAALLWLLGLDFRFEKDTFLVTPVCVCMLDQTKHELVLCGGALCRQCPGNLSPKWLCVLRILSNTVHM